MIKLYKSNRKKGIGEGGQIEQLGKIEEEGKIYLNWKIETTMREALKEKTGINKERSTITEKVIKMSMEKRESKNKKIRNEDRKEIKKFRRRHSWRIKNKKEKKLEKSIKQIKDRERGDEHFYKL